MESLTPARCYLAKPVADLSWAEVAFLTAIPQSPSRMNPFTGEGPLGGGEGFSMPSSTKESLAKKSTSSLSGSSRVFLFPSAATVPRPRCTLS